jgi:hypothetical protein
MALPLTNFLHIGILVWHPQFLQGIMKAIWHFHSYLTTKAHFTWRPRLNCYGPKINFFGPTIGFNTIINYTIFMCLSHVNLFYPSIGPKSYLMSFFLSSSFSFTLPMQDFQFVFSSLLSHFLTFS